MIGMLLATWLNQGTAPRTVLPVSACPSGETASVIATSVVVDPRDADRVVAVAGTVLRVLRTSPRGDCLVPSDRGLEPMPLFYRPINPGLLSIDPQQPDTLYLGSGQGVFRSTDRGRSWQQRTGGILFELSEADVGEVAVDPLRSECPFRWGIRDLQVRRRRVLLGLYSRTDFLRGSYPSPMDSHSIRAIPMSCISRRIGCSSHRTAGSFGTPMDQGLPGTAMAVLVDRLNPDVVYAGTPDGIFVSPDGAATWRALGLSRTIAILHSCRGPANPRDLLRRDRLRRVSHRRRGHGLVPIGDPFCGLGRLPDSYRAERSGDDLRGDGHRSLPESRRRGELAAAGDQS